jgi:carbonic anhydrase
MNHFRCRPRPSARPAPPADLSLDVEYGNLTGLLARIKPAITATKFDGEKSSKNAPYVDAVARTNVVLGLDAIRRRSPILEDLEKKGTIKITGAMYDLSNGMVEFVG